MAEIQFRSTNLSNIAVGELIAKFSADGSRILRYYIDFRHKVLNLHKDLSAPEISILQSKVDAVMAQWDRKHAEFEEKSLIAYGKDSAVLATIEAEEKLAGLSRILAHTLRVDDQIDWDSLKDHSTFAQCPESWPRPVMPRQYAEPEYYLPRITIWDKLFGRKTRKIAAKRKDFEQAHADWEKYRAERQAEHESRLAEWQGHKAELEKNHAEEEMQFYLDQAVGHAKVDDLVTAYRAGDVQAVIEHATMVLDNSNYEDLFEKSFEIEYSSSAKTLMLEYELPSPDKMPTVKSVRFVSSTGEIRETHITDKEQRANFDSTCYQICLRTIHELFEADDAKNHDKLLFNGFTTYVDKATGKDVRSCIMSVLVGRDEFLAIDLSRVDPRACFKSLKGVSASTLSALAPIPPVMKMNRSDKRFIEARDTVSGLSEETNLASMSWDDFEHLVRELFEKEFAARGGEVKVTQSSSDGGVDAIAFDPDPISGGKIVIQAKRYTRTVGVSAVRDLYGTLLNEGASKGLLVTTADYGPDAHKFASGKPITLISGSNLLHLLAKHGYQAKIDIREARKELSLRDRE
jgi:restriction system protein